MYVELCGMGFEEVSEHLRQTEPLKEVISLKTHLQSEKATSFQFSQELTSLKKQNNKLMVQLQMAAAAHKENVENLKSAEDAAAEKACEEVQKLHRNNQDIQRQWEEAQTKLDKGKEEHSKMEWDIWEQNKVISQLQAQLDDTEGEKEWYRTKRDQEWSDAEEYIAQLEEDKHNLEIKVEELENKVEVMEQTLDRYDHRRSRVHSNPSDSSNSQWQMQSWNRPQQWQGRCGDGSWWAQAKH